MNEYGIILVSHSKDIANGLLELIRQVAKDVPLTCAGGNEDGGIGTSFEAVSEAVSSNAGKKLLAFFDLGSARMNLEAAGELSEKELTVYTVPLIEGSYTAASLLQAGAAMPAIEEQLKAMEITK